MKQSVRILLLSALAAALCVPAVLAQSAPAPQDQQNPQAQPSQPAQDQNTGVSQPPPDSTIQADEDPATPPPAPPTAKPSAAIPAAPVTAAPVAPAPTVQPMARTSASRNPAFANEVDNTDSGIVTVVPESGAAPGLEQRPSAADDGIVSSVATNANELSAGTNITVRLTQALSTSETQPGTAFHATVAHDVFSGPNLVIPTGSEMRGHVIDVSQGHHFGSHATMRLRPDVVVLPDGTAYHLYADVVQSSAAGTHADDEGGIEASNHYKKDAVEYGAAAGTGAVVGAEVAGPVGAGVGTLVGAGVVTTHLLLQNPQAAHLPTGSVLVFSLTEPMGLTPTKN